MEINFPQKEEKILKFWQKNKIFEKSIGQRKKQRNFVFYEGPPTANGKPGIHHVLSRTFKDIICRYKTMQGFKVLRKAGWDTHGLPVELQVEKELGLKNKKEIEKFGIAKFNKFCRQSVWSYKKDWEELTERIAFWLDMKNPYITYQPEYIETVWWIIKRIWQKGLIYRDYKVIPYCSRCGTGLSSHEVAQGYKKVKDRSVFLKFKVISSQPRFKNASIISWTTTPWTLPGNVALAVNAKLDYLKVKLKKETVILAKEKLEVLEEKYKILDQFKGKELIGLKYKPLFDLPELKNNNSHQVYSADFVTAKEGTGIVHTAVMYGEDDYKIGKRVGLPTFHTVDQEGKFIKTLKSGLADLYVKSEKAEQLILEHLKKNNLFFKEELYEHDYPFCWRCSSPLLYYAKESWFINMQAVKNDLIENNKKINWLPSHLKKGRFGEWLKEVKDWVISRERYWGTPLPIWQCKKCQSLQVIGSKKDLISQKFSQNQYFILRHGYSLRNKEKLVVCWPEKIHCPLTKRGEKEIQKIALKLKKQKKIDLIFSSDLLRAKQTSEIVGQEIGLKPKFDKRLREIDLGRFNGKTVKEANAFWAPGKKLKKADYYLKRFEIRAPGGENYSDVKKRVYHFLKEIDKKYQNKRIIIVSHELPLSMLEAAVKGLSKVEAMKFRKKKQIKTGQLRKIEFKLLPYDGKGELDFHRPYIDQVKFYCSQCFAREKKGELMERRPDVLDCWFDSGSMPFAQAHWPTDKQSQKIKPPELFPADYISEAIDQTRGWFYTLHAISTLLGFGPSYKNVISLGHVLDEKGEKMSKSKGNVVNPRDVINSYGVDAIRWYFFTVNQPGDSKLFSEKDVEQTFKKFILIFWNCFQFFQTYRESSKYKIKSKKQKLKIKNILDRWIISRLNELIEETTIKLDLYDVTGAARIIENFVINDFSLWYIRRSRKRFQEAEQIFAFVLEVLSKLTAPFIPFLSEEIYREISGKDERSVHLADWPKADKKLIDKGLNKKMEKVREIVAKALSERAKAGIKVRQPLGKLQINRFVSRQADYNLEKEEELLELIKDEINVKEIVFGKNFKLETKITLQLKEEGAVREIIRQIQEMRKKAGFRPRDEIFVEYSTESNDLDNFLLKNKNLILKEARIINLVSVKKDKIVSRQTKEIKIDQQKLVLSIKKI